ncbi:MAG: DUF531 family protein, partial [Thermoplasmata archaeon]|nr:DUF531 family protein [Thermoplasmata archaeon]
EERISLWKELSSIVRDMDSGKGLSDAIRGCAPRLPKESIQIFFRRGLHNRGFDRDDTRAVLRRWAALNDVEGMERLINDIMRMRDSTSKVRLMGYLRLQLSRNEVSIETDLLVPSLTSSIALGEESIESLRYIINGSNGDDIETIRTVLKDIKNTNVRVRSTMTLAGFAERVKEKEISNTLLDEAKAEIEGIEDPALKHSLNLHLAQALLKGGHEDEGKKALVTAMDTRKELKTRPQEPREITHSEGKRHVLALFDGYEGGIKPTHTRAVARAAPLCVAYDLDLALLGFPTNDLQVFIKQIRADTNVGEGGRYLDQLFTEERITLINCTWKDPPKDYPALPVATTSKPDVKKMDIPSGEKLCMIMGLGKKGLPPSLINDARYHLELTGRNIPLETCTAMGAIAERMKG